MVQCLDSQIDRSFAALSDATRRGVLAQLGIGSASITELATRFDMTLTGMKKHVQVLEAAGLARTEKVGRTRRCSLGPRGVETEITLLERYRQMWADRFATLDRLVETLAQEEKADGRNSAE